MHVTVVKKKVIGIGLRIRTYVMEFFIGGMRYKMGRFCIVTRSPDGSNITSE